MHDWGYYLRQAYYNVLNNQVMYEDAYVPVVDEKTDQRYTEGDIYIKLFTQNESQNNNKCYFAANGEMVVDIVHRTQTTGSKMVVDKIGDQILQLLFPTRRTTALILSSPFVLSYARFERSDTSPLQSANGGFIQVKSIIFSNRVIQPT